MHRDSRGHEVALSLPNDNPANGEGRTIAHSLHLQHHRLADQTWSQEGCMQRVRKPISGRRARGRNNSLRQHVAAERPTTGAERNRREPVITVRTEIQQIKQAGQRRTPSAGRDRR
jgi:hypothetical protein